MSTYKRSFPRDNAELHATAGEIDQGIYVGNPRAATLTISQQQARDLEPYLPPERTCFLKEDVEPPSVRPGVPGYAELPHVTLTYAQSLDSQISLQPGARTILSGPSSKAMTHYLRARHDAILIGAGTALADNPSLNSRFSYDGVHIIPFSHQPKPIILDPSGKCPWTPGQKLFRNVDKHVGRSPWWILSQDAFSSTERLASLGTRANSVREHKGRDIVVGKYDRTEDGVDWFAILSNLGRAGIRSVMIEGGATVINDLLKLKNQAFIDSLIVTIAPTYLGAGGVVVAPFRNYRSANALTLDDVRWLHYDQDIVMAWGKSQVDEVSYAMVDGATSSTIMTPTSSEARYVQEHREELTGNFIQRSQDASRERHPQQLPHDVSGQQTIQHLTAHTDFSTRDDALVHEGEETETVARRPIAYPQPYYPDKAGNGDLVSAFESGAPRGSRSIPAFDGPRLSSLGEPSTQCPGNMPPDFNPLNIALSNMAPPLCFQPSIVCFEQGNIDLPYMETSTFSRRESPNLEPPNFGLLNLNFSVPAQPPSPNGSDISNPYEGEAPRDRLSKMLRSLRGHRTSQQRPPRARQQDPIEDNQLPVGHPSQQVQRDIQGTGQGNSARVARKRAFEGIIADT